MSSVQAFVEGIADHRAAIHEGHSSSRPLSDGYEGVGLKGEFAFGKWSGHCPDLSDKPGGDKGIDFTIPLLYTVDVKTARKAFNLIHEEGKPFADIYVLAEVRDDREAFLVGWEWGSVLAKAPTKDFGYGVINHYIPAEELREMDELGARMFRVPRMLGT